MLIVTTPTVPGYSFEAVIGLVSSGNAPDLLPAMADLWRRATQVGGNAVVGAHFGVYTRGDSLGQFFAYGTAAVIKPIPQGQPGSTPQSAAQALE